VGSPYRLGQIGLVGNQDTEAGTEAGCTLPIGSNRISWKPELHREWFQNQPYRLGQIGLVGNKNNKRKEEQNRNPTDWVKSD